MTKLLFRLLGLLVFFGDAYASVQLETANPNQKTFSALTSSIPVNFFSPGKLEAYRQVVPMTGATACPDQTQLVRLIEERQANGFEVYDMPLYACLATAKAKGGFEIPESNGTEVLYFGGVYGQYKDYETPRPNPITGSPLKHVNPYTGSASCDTSKGFEAIQIYGFKGIDWGLNVCLAKKSAAEPAPYPDKSFRGFVRDSSSCVNGVAHQVYGTIGNPHSSQDINMDNSLFLCLEDDSPSGDLVAVRSLSLMGLDSYVDDSTGSILGAIADGMSIPNDLAFAFTIKADVEFEGRMVDDRFPHDFDGDGQVSADETPVQPPFRIKFEYEKLSGPPIGRNAITRIKFAPYVINYTNENTDGTQSQIYFWTLGDSSVGDYRVTATPIAPDADTVLGPAKTVQFSIFDPDDSNTGGLPKPFNLTSGELTETSVRLFWEMPPADADQPAITSYNIVNSAGQIVETSSNTAETIEGLNPNTEYEFRVQAVFDDGQTGPFSDTITITTLGDDGGTTGDDNTNPNVDPEGWSDLQPSSDSLMIYVSTSGDDNNPGTEAAPIRTPAEAKRRVRDGMPDWILFKRDDHWTGSSARLGNWTKSGRSVDEKMVITSYGTGARPKFTVPTFIDDNDQIANENFLRLSPRNASNRIIKHVAIRDLDFRASVYSGKGRGIVSSMNLANDDISKASSLEDILIEGNYIEGFYTNISIESQKYYSQFQPKNIFIRRNIIVEGRGGSHAQGIFSNGVQNLVIEENIIDRNAWDVNRGRDQTATIFGHCVYVQRSLQPDIHVLTFKNNFVSRCGSHALQARNGGFIENNFVVDSPIGLQSGNEMDARVEKAVYTEVLDNVVMDAIDINSNNLRGHFYNFQGLRRETATNARSLISNNIASETLFRSGQPKSFRILGNPDYSTDSRGVDFKDNILRNLPGFYVSGDADIVDDFLFRSNDLVVGNFDYLLSINSNVWGVQYSNNRYSGNFDAPSSGWSSFNPDTAYPDANRNLDDYARLILGPGNDRGDFFREIRKLQRGDWDERLTAPAINDYIRAGFGR